MATQNQHDDIHAFYDFLGQRLQNGGVELSPEQSVDEFRAYQQELQRFIDETQPAIAQGMRGESKPLDTEAMMERIRKRLEGQGSSN